MNKNNICVVDGCKNAHEKKTTFHEFPLINYELSLQWLNAINKENWVPSRNSKVCSDHFQKCDFVGEKLSNTAIPSCNLLKCNGNITTIFQNETTESCGYHVTLPPDAHFCCVWGCTINSVKQPKNAFHLLPLNHQLTICDCIGLRTPIDPIEFLSNSLEICDQHFKQNAMLLYINTEITSNNPTTKIKLIKKSLPNFCSKSNNNSSTTKDSPVKLIQQNSDDVILNEDDLLHFDFSLNKEKSLLKNTKTSQEVFPNKSKQISLLKTNAIKDQEIAEFYDIDNICRLCLRTGDLVQIYGYTYNHISINDMVGSCINLHNPIEKKFPQKVCKKCLYTLKTVYNFVMDCKRSTNILDNFFKQQKATALKSLLYDHNYDKTTQKTKINLQELMENAGIDVVDTFGSNDLEASITEPDEILKDTVIPPDVIQKIKNAKLKEYTRKIPKKVLDTIAEKADLDIGGKKFILAKAFTCKQCNDIFFSQESFDEHVRMCCTTSSDTATNYKKCEKCPKLLKNQFEELTHKCVMIKKKRKNPLKCYKCNEKLKCLSMFATHKCNALKPKKLAPISGKKRIIYKKCKTCGKKYLSHKELTKHRKLVHPETIAAKNPICGYCSLNFNNMEELKKHRNESHGQNRIITCPTCMKQMTASQYANHKLVHTIERRFCCEFCGNRFKSATNFRSHIDKVHLGLKPYICDICNRAYNTRTKLLEHHNVHTGTKTYMCDSCGARFSYKSCLASHIKKKRCGKTKGLAKEHTCPICNEIVMSRRLLIQHKKESHGLLKGTVARKTYTCEICKIPCESAADLRIHEAIHGDKTYICHKPNCRRPFFTAERLNRHFTVHETVNAKCEICAKSFSSKISLNMHMKTHTGEKNYHCSYCPKQFTQQGHLISHTRTHTGAKPYKCKFCDKAFAMSGNLTVHTRTHTGQRPYECNYCDQAFFDASSRKRHMIQKHRFSFV